MRPAVSLASRIPGAPVRRRAPARHYPDPVALTRRSALTLLAVTGLSGCAFEPISWETPDPSKPTTPSTPDGVEVRPDYFAQSGDSGARTLPEGVPVPQRIATPHLDARLDRIFAGDSLGAVTAAQVRERTAIRAPKGSELIAFTLEAGSPAFGGPQAAQVDMGIDFGDGQRYPIKSPFGLFSADRGTYDRGWALCIFSVPIGSTVLLTVADQGKVVTLDLRTGKPVDDEGWRANRGFRERIEVEVVGGAKVLERDLVTAPVNGHQLTTRLRMGLDPVAAHGLVPWSPDGGWAEGDRQWLRLATKARVEFVPSDPSVVIDLDVPRSFSYAEAQEAPIAARLPESITTESIQRGSAELDVTWLVPGLASQAVVSISPVGTAAVRFSDHPDVGAQFTGEAPQVSYVLTFTPRNQ